LEKSKLIKMKAKLLIQTLALVSSAMLSAQQTTLITQNFENPTEVQDQGWGGIDGDGNEVTFELIGTQATLVTLGFTGSVMYSSNFALDDENNPVVIEGSDNSLVSPILDLPAGQSVELSLRLAGAGATATARSHYSIYVINAEDLAGAATVEELNALVDAQTPIAQNSVNGVSSVLTYDISDHAGETVLIFMRHHLSQGATYLFIDDIYVTTGVLSVAGVNKSGLTIYPNPVQSQISISNPAGSKINEVTITDNLGRNVKVYKNPVQDSFNVEDLPSGTYMLQVKTDLGNVMKKIIKN
jgi:hypothetical protein